MIPSRRADGPSPALATALRLTISALGASLAVLGGVMAVIAGRLARRVVTPAVRQADTVLLGLDTNAQTVTLSRTPDTRLPGRYGLFTSGSASYLKVGTVLSETDTAVTRKLLTHIAPDAHLSPQAAFSGWYFDQPEQLHLAYSSEAISTPVGECPAWLFPPEPDSAAQDVWVIHIHGRGTTRAEALRAVPVFHDLGITNLLVSYRNDGEAPSSRHGTYTLGATEWRDVDAAIAFARERGARRIVLMGWSMGGAVALQLALTSAHRESITALILDSPAIDWGVVLRHQAGLHRLPRPLVGLTLGALGSRWARPVRGGGEPIPFDRLDVIARAGELRHPMLILHSEDDGFVPADASHELARARPDLVALESFRTARHTKLWNFDEKRWSAAISSWLSSVLDDPARASGS
ncbi:alpha/beta fold hydrolase [Microbacterium sp. LRZ72]|uniref:alpha/beta hydrolase n=1 Tax=Microbacterium sp. LRZ72 TaxID=2942481 RepID=UPI0029B1E1D5|nr:alpha/beta fold hydrolase [Microbacterium sp. LRZ72]MDX2375351.1 alpha/beta fold hydrolase [Microbacterium sp. LRZ72]